MGATVEFRHRNEAFGDEAQPDLDTIPDIPRNSGKYECVMWKMEPGDLVLHHPRAVHGAHGNSSPTPRQQALSLRGLGDDVRWDNSPSRFLRAPALAAMIGLKPQVQGAPICGKKGARENMPGQPHGEER